MGEKPHLFIKMLVLFRKGLPPQGFGILCQGHTGVLFKYGGEVIDVVITHSHCDLGEVQTALLDHPFRLFDSQSCQIGNHRITGVFLENALQLGNADTLTGCQGFQSNPLRIMLCQVFLDLYSNLGMVMKLIDRNCAGIKMNAVFMTINQNQKILKQIFYDLLGAEGDVIPGHQIYAGSFVVREHIIKVTEGGFRFFQNGGQNILFLGAL